MNRRNFLKLFGLLVVPTSALATVKPDTVETTVPTVELEADNADWMILETPNRQTYNVEIDNMHVQCLKDETAEDTKQHIKWCKTVGIHTDSEFLLVSKKSMVYVTAPSGQRVWFHPQWDTVGERFETVVIEIETCHDIFMSEDDTTILESKVTTMTARNTDGKLITKSIWS